MSRKVDCYGVYKLRTKILNYGVSIVNFFNQPARFNLRLFNNRTFESACSVSVCNFPCKLMSVWCIVPDLAKKKKKRSNKK